MSNNSYILYCDGASKGNPGPAGIGAVLFQGDKIIFSKGKPIGINTNNVAEYTSVIYGLQEVLKLNIKDIQLRMDSELVINQINGKYKVKNNNLKKLHMELKLLISQFNSFNAEHVYRESNSGADHIASQMALNN